MTREERENLVNGLSAMDPRDIVGKARPAAQVICDAAAAELRKTCATCKHWATDREYMPWPICLNDMPMPEDGSGFCDRHEAKP